MTVVGEPAWERARSAAGRSAWAHLLRPLAQRIEARAPELAVQIGDHVRGELPELFEDPRALAENRASTEASILVLTELLGRGRAPQLEQLPPAMLAYARESAQQGVPLTSLLRGYRVGFTVLWQEVLAELADLATDRAELGEAVALASAWMFAYADAAQTHTEAFYVTQRERWLRSAVAAQAETLDAILGGRETDAAVAERHLRHALDRHHLGVVAWLDDGDDEEGARRLDAALDELQACSGADGSLVHPRGRRTVVAWLSRRAVFDTACLERLRLAEPAAAGVRVALGEPARGLTGFRRTYDEAWEAHRVAIATARPAGSVTRYGRVELVALASQDPARARSFVQRELAGLAGDDDTARRLAATVRVYLEEQSSRSRTARRLGVHENTVRYRVRQAEGLLGHGLGERTLEVRLALLLAAAVR